VVIFQSPALVFVPILHVYLLPTRDEGNEDVSLYNQLKVSLQSSWTTKDWVLETKVYVVSIAFELHVISQFIECESKDEFDATKDEGALYKS